MSIESAGQFVTRMKTDKGFAALVARAKSQEDRWSVIRAAGFDFNKDDFDMVYDEGNDEALLATASGSVLRSRECVCCKL
jgi:predicted ribosomally synthesized peptide with nif11-like leader